MRILGQVVQPAWLARRAGQRCDDKPGIRAVLEEAEDRVPNLAALRAVCLQQQRLNAASRLLWASAEHPGRESAADAGEETGEGDAACPLRRNLDCHGWTLR